MWRAAVAPLCNSICENMSAVKWLHYGSMLELITKIDVLADLKGNGLSKKRDRLRSVSEIARSTKA
jgi:hypothetical protein